jgi:hypothetical protein
MICPHCRTSLLRKQRTRSRCSSCRRVFAFDPKTNRLKLHDLRFIALTRRLAGRGREGLPDLRYTADQLRFAATRKVLAEGSTSSGWQGCAWMLAVPGLIAAVLLAAAGGWAEGGVVFVGVAVVVGGLVFGHFATADRRRYPGAPVDRAAFAAMLARWQQVYGRPPGGLLPPGRSALVAPNGPPRAVLVCPDADTVAFLAAAGLVQRHPVVLVADPAALDGRPSPAVIDAARAGLPVLLLHDADPRGCLAAALLRAALPGARVVDAGLRPRVGRAVATALRVRPPDGLAERLRAAGTDLDADELSWLADGCVVPLAAVLPARLLAGVERAVRRATTADPDRARARAVGFLTAPGAHGSSA